MDRRHAHRHLPDARHWSPFGPSSVARLAEAIADGIGTTKFIAGSAVCIVGWILVNAVAASAGWDPYPFILLNLLFSAQAFFAASFTVLAVKRQADRERIVAEAAAEHRQEEANRAREELHANTAMTRQVESLVQSQAATLLAVRTLATEVHQQICQKNPSSSVRSGAASPRSRKKRTSSAKSKRSD